MSYLPPSHAQVGAQLRVEYMGEQYPVTVQTNDATSLFDPGNNRVRS
jgi:glycine cleavage system aminomethyltransferase T